MSASRLQAMAEKVRNVPYTGTPPETWDNTPEPGDVSFGGALSKDPARSKQYRAQLDKWLSNPYELDERWSIRAKRELNEQPDRLHEEVDKMRRLVNAEQGLNSRTDDHFLLSFLRAKRHEVKPAFKSLQKYYRMRKLNPTYFELCLPSSSMDIYKLKAISILDGRDVLGRPICYFNADFAPNKLTNLQFVQILAQLLDFLVIDPRVQVAGIAILVNLEKQGIAHTKIITIKFLKLMLQIFQGSYPMRMKSITVCHGSFMFRTTFAILRPFIPEKFKERIHILSSDLSTLPNYIPTDVLPPELQGQGPPWREDLLAERMNLLEDWFVEIQTYGYTEDAVINTRRSSMDFTDEVEEPPIPISDREFQRRITSSAIVLNAGPSQFRGSTQPRQNRPVESISATETTEATQPTQPIRQAETTQPIRQAETTQPIRQAETTQPIRQAETTQPIRQAETTQPIRQAETTQPIRQAETTRPTRQAETSQPIVAPQPSQAPQSSQAPLPSQAPVPPTQITQPTSADQSSQQPRKKLTCSERRSLLSERVQASKTDQTAHATGVSQDQPSETDQLEPSNQKKKIVKKMCSDKRNVNNDG